MPGWVTAPRWAGPTSLANFQMAPEPYWVTRGFQSQGQPPWILRHNTSAGVISPYFGQMMQYDLPPGEYLIACFWPASDTGLPHAFMGMFKLIHLA